MLSQHKAESGCSDEVNLRTEEIPLRMGKGVAWLQSGKLWLVIDNWLKPLQLGA